MSYKIALDSCGELTADMKADPHFVSVPLTIQVGDLHIVDDESFNQAAFLKAVAACPEPAKTACPSPDKYREAFDDPQADHVYAVTLSGALSGSYNSALLGREITLEDHPDKKIHVFNSRSASVGQTLIALKIQELEEQGFDFDTIVRLVEEYIASQKTWFILENLETLRKNGRLSNLKAKMATMLRIRPVMTSTPEGSIEQLCQARGSNKAMVMMADDIAHREKNEGPKRVGISHCNNPERAEMVRDALMARMQVSDVVLVDTGGISSTYANDGGIIVVV